MGMLLSIQHWQDFDPLPTRLVRLLRYHDYYSDPDTRGAPTLQLEAATGTSGEGRRPGTRREGPGPGGWGGGGGGWGGGGGGVVVHGSSCRSLARWRDPGHRPSPFCARFWHLGKDQGSSESPLLGLTALVVLRA